MNPQTTIFEKRRFTANRLWPVAILIPALCLMKSESWIFISYFAVLSLVEYKSNHHLLILAYENKFIIIRNSLRAEEWNFSDIVSIDKRKAGLTLKTINFQKIRINNQGISDDTWQSVIQLFESRLQNTK